MTYCSSATRRCAGPPVVVNLATGVAENPERVMLALFAAESASNAGRPTLLFVSLNAVNALLSEALAGVIPCKGCPPLDRVLRQVVEAGAEIYACPMCLRARDIAENELVSPAISAGTAGMMDWIGDRDATVFSF